MHMNSYFVFVFVERRVYVFLFLKILVILNEILRKTEKNIM